MYIAAADIKQIFVTLVELQKGPVYVAEIDKVLSTNTYRREMEHPYALPTFTAISYKLLQGLEARTTRAACYILVNDPFRKHKTMYTEIHGQLLNLEVTHWPGDKLMAMIYYLNDNLVDADGNIQQGGYTSIEIALDDVLNKNGGIYETDRYTYIFATDTNKIAALINQRKGGTKKLNDIILKHEHESILNRVSEEHNAAVNELKTKLRNETDERDSLKRRHQLTLEELRAKATQDMENLKERMDAEYEKLMKERDALREENKEQRILLDSYKTMFESYREETKFRKQNYTESIRLEKERISVVGAALKVGVPLATLVIGYILAKNGGKK
jgi:hypothetical protein